jgi:osmotically-inducible protein OsmY
MQMNNKIFAAGLSVYMLFMSLGCMSMRGETAGEYLDDTTTTSQVNQIIVKDADARYFKIDVKTLQGDVVLIGFVNSKETEERLLLKISNIQGVKSVKSLLKIEEKSK